MEFYGHVINRIFHSCSCIIDFIKLVGEKPSPTHLINYMSTRVRSLYYTALHESICCGYSLGSTCRGISNEYPQQKVLWRNMGNYALIEPCSEKTCFMPYANNKGADQPAHPWSLISGLVVRCLDSIIHAKSKITWSQTLKTGFLGRGSIIISYPPYLFLCFQFLQKRRNGKTKERFVLFDVLFSVTFDLVLPCGWNVSGSALTYCKTHKNLDTRKNCCNHPKS